MTIEDFKLERYKYILMQLAALNDNVHKYLLFYQTLVSAILGGVGAFIVLSVEHKMSRAVVIGVLNSAGVLLALVGLFTCLLVFSAIASWIDYRNEESELLNTVVNESFRRAPRLRNFWRWPETYVLLFVILGSSVIWALLHTLVVTLTR